MSTVREPRWPLEEDEPSSGEGFASLPLIGAICLVPAAVLLVLGHAGWALGVFWFSALAFAVFRLQVSKAKRRFMRETLELTLRDELTGIASRRMFLEELRTTLRQRSRKDRFTALFFLDLDSFKSINDTLGHSAGDQVLTTVAARLSQVVTRPNLVARIGGDELAVLCPEMGGREAVIGLADDIMREFSKPVKVGSLEVWANASMGIVMVSTARPSPDDMLVMADTALYQAKNKGKGQYVLFESHLPTPVVRSPSLDADLRSAILNKEFVLHYQPIVRLDDLHVTGFEALIRWQHPKLGTLGPAHFIPLAEETGFISQLGDWIIQRSFDQVALWRSLSDERLTMNINLSALQFRQRDMLVHFWRTCSSSGVPPGLITFEITESFFLQDDEVTLSNLEGLHSMGFGIAIDDFGVGYSSLSYLGRYDIDVLKIDRSFLANAENPRDRALLDGIVRLGNSMGIPMVAEGIETVEQLELLQELRCDLGQGYLLSMPLSEQAVVDGLASGELTEINLDALGPLLPDARAA